MTAFITARIMCSFLGALTATPKNDFIDENQVTVAH